METSRSRIKISFILYYMNGKRFTNKVISQYILDKLRVL